MNTQTSRRRFLQTSLLGGLAAAAMPGSLRAAAGALAGDPKSNSRVSLIHGTDRADIAFRALQPFARQIAAAIGDRRVVMKPNNVAIDVQLCATHPGCLEGILEFLKSIDKAGNVVIAESAANGPTFEGFNNYGYDKLAKKYGAKLVDLDQEAIEVVHVFDEKDFKPHPVRMSRLMLDRNNFLISAAKLKTHDRIVATLSLKNIIFGAPIKDLGFRWGKGSQAGAKNDKPIAHGSGIRAINFNLFDLARRMHPHLSVIDGYDGMEGNGPVGGSLVEHRVCLAGLDWLATDRVGVELMGIDYAKVGYLNYCASAGLGEGDINKIEILGEPIVRHIKQYKLAKNIQEQLMWMSAPQKV